MSLRVFFFGTQWKRKMYREVCCSQWSVNSKSNTEYRISKSVISSQ